MMTRSITLLYFIALQSVLANSWQLVALLFAAYFLIDGGCAIIAGVKSYVMYKSSLLILDGVLRVIFCLAFLTTKAPLLLLAIIIVGGFIEIAAAIKLRKHVTGFLFLTAAIVSVVYFPLVVLIHNFIFGLQNTEFFGLYAIIFGSLMLAFGVRMRQRVRDSGKQKEGAA